MEWLGPRGRDGGIDTLTLPVPTGGISMCGKHAIGPDPAAAIARWRRAEAERLTAPFRRLVTDGRPWVIAKWAMSLDGRIATHSGDSRWISGEASRALVHALRGRMDRAQIAAIIAKQMPDREKRRRADLVVRTGLSRFHSVRTLRRWQQGLAP